MMPELGSGRMFKHTARLKDQLISSPPVKYTPAKWLYVSTNIYTHTLYHSSVTTVLHNAFATSTALCIGFLPL